LAPDTPGFNRVPRRKLRTRKCDRYQITFFDIRGSTHDRPYTRAHINLAYTKLVSIRMGSHFVDTAHNTVLQIGITVNQGFYLEPGHGERICQFGHIHVDAYIILKPA
jgi:hypothetical protein